MPFVFTYFPAIYGFIIFLNSAPKHTHAMLSTQPFNQAPKSTSYNTNLIKQSEIGFENKKLTTDLTSYRILVTTRPMFIGLGYTLYRLLQLSCFDLNLIRPLTWTNEASQKQGSSIFKAGKFDEFKVYILIHVLNYYPNSLSKLIDIICYLNNKKYN